MTLPDNPGYQEDSTSKDTCGQVVGATPDGTRVVTCDKPLPCPDHTILEDWTVDRVNGIIIQHMVLRAGQAWSFQPSRRVRAIHVNPTNRKAGPIHITLFEEDET